MIAYRIAHKVTGKSYIGITTQPLRCRWAEHKRVSRSPRAKAAGALHKAIAAHGTDAFSVEEIACATTAADLLEVERLLIEQEGTIAPAGYNLCAGGRGVLSPSSETLAILSKIRTGRRHSDATKALVSTALTGRPVSAETREKIAATKRGKKRPADVVARVAAGVRGFKHSPEAIEKIAEAARKPRGRYPAERVARSKAARAASIALKKVAMGVLVVTPPCRDESAEACRGEPSP